MFHAPEHSVLRAVGRMAHGEPTIRPTRIPIDFYARATCDRELPPIVTVVCNGCAISQAKGQLRDYSFFKVRCAAGAADRSFRIGPLTLPSLPPVAQPKDGCEIGCRLRRFGASRQGPWAAARGADPASGQGRVGRVRRASGGGQVGKVRRSFRIGEPSMGPHCPPDGATL